MPICSPEGERAWEQRLHMTDKPTLDQWAAAADKEVKSKDLTWHTAEGIDVKPLYTAEDLQTDPGLPGFAPFTRSDTHTFELQSLIRISYDFFCLKKKT